MGGDDRDWSDDVSDAEAEGVIREAMEKLRARRGGADPRIDAGWTPFVDALEVEASPATPPCVLPGFAGGCRLSRDRRKRASPRLTAALRRPIDRFAARQALDAQLAVARIERVLGSRRRLGNAIDTAMDAILIARRAGVPAVQMDRYRERHKRARRRLDRYERAVEPVVRDHDEAVRREALTRERQHEREREWQRRKRERAEAARGRQQPGRTAEPTPPAAERRSPSRAAPSAPTALLCIVVPKLS